MAGDKPLHVSVLGAGSTYGIYLVKWAYQLLKSPESNRENLAVPPVGSVSYSNTNPRNRDLVFEVLRNDLQRMPGFEKETNDTIKEHVRGYTDWREMVSKEKPDLLVITTPTETHAGLIRELVTDHGIKNILCETPLTPLTENGAWPGLVKLAKDAGVTLGVNLQYASLTDMIRDVPIQPDKKDPLPFSALADSMTSAEVTFITHGTRAWRHWGQIGEQVILEDLGAHALYFLPPLVRNQPVTVKKVSREGDNLFVNLVEYELLFGKVPVKLTLGYRRRLKSLKVVITRDRKGYEFHLSGVRNPLTGEYTRQVEGKNYAYPFRYALPTDLVKYSFMRSLAGKPLVGLEDALRNHATLRAIMDGSVQIK